MKQIYDYYYYRILTLWCPAGYEDFQKKKTPKRTWFCVGISLVLYAQ